MASGRPHGGAAEECSRSLMRFQNHGDRVPRGRENVARRVLSLTQRQAEAGGGEMEVGPLGVWPKAKYLLSWSLNSCEGREIMNR